MQTSYTNERAIGREGTIAQAYPGGIETGYVDEASGIAPGRFVTIGTADKDVQLPDAAADITTAGLLVGVVLLDETREPLASGVYADNEPVPVMRKGRVWMLAEDAVDDGGQVFVRHTAAGAEELGRVRSDADTSDAAIAPSCVFKSTTTATDELVIVELNLP